MSTCILRAKTVKKYLLKKNISQNELAFSLGTTSGYMSQLIRGVRTPGPVFRNFMIKKLKIDRWDDWFEAKD